MAFQFLEREEKGYISEASKKSMRLIKKNHITAGIIEEKIKRIAMRYFHLWMFLFNGLVYYLKSGKSLLRILRKAETSVMTIAHLSIMASK